MVVAVVVASEVAVVVKNRCAAKALGLLRVGAMGPSVSVVVGLVVGNVASGVVAMARRGAVVGPVGFGCGCFDLVVGLPLGLDPDLGVVRFIVRGLVVVLGVVGWEGLRGEGRGGVGEGLSVGAR